MGSIVIPPASEARRQAESLTNAKVQEQLEKVSKAIKDAVARGDLKTDFTSALLVPVKKELERQGYKLEQLSDPREGPWTVISW